MPTFSSASRARLDTCDPRLQRLCEAVVGHWDCTVIEGHRDQARQDEMVRTGRSHLMWPNSRHNLMPSLAVDLGPYYRGEGIPWDDRERWMAFGGFVLGVGAELGITLRWGGDWNGNRRFRDQRFHDLPHFEIPKGAK